MKKMVLFLMVASLLAIVAACEKPTTEEVFEKADALHADIKIIVTDPAVASLIPQATMDRLALAESIYLAARAAFDSDQADNPEAMALLASCADDLINVLDDLPVVDQYADRIAAARVIIKLLRNHV